MNTRKIVKYVEWEHRDLQFICKEMIDILNVVEMWKSVTMCCATNIFKKLEGMCWEGVPLVDKWKQIYNVNVRNEPDLEENKVVVLVDKE